MVLMHFTMAQEHCANRGKRIIILLVSIPISIVLVILLFLLFWTFCDYHFPKYSTGTYCLGNSLYLYPRTGEECDLGIVLGTTVRGKACYGGYELIPEYSESEKNHRRSLIDVRMDERWIVAVDYDFDTGVVKYHVVDKSFDKDICSVESIKQDYIRHFNSINDYNQYCIENGISLSITDRHPLINKTVL